MDILTFIAEIIKALAWPVTILVIFMILRRRVMELLPFIERLRYGGLEVDFNRRIQELAQDVRREIPIARQTSSGQRRTGEYTNQLAELSPRAVILESWLELEEAAIDAARRHGLELGSQEMRSPLLLGAALQQAGIFDEPKQQIFYRLRNLRNAATHASDFAFDAPSALEYAESAGRLTDYIRQA